MQVAVHEDFAKRISTYVGEKLPEEALISGAVAPNRDPTFPTPHHLNRRAGSILTECVKAARRAYIAKRYSEAAFQLGTAMHYALDNLVPYREGSTEHAVCESRFAQIDRSLDYRVDIPRAFGDGRLAERSVKQLARMASVKPLNFERRLQEASLCFLRLACAVTEEAEPIEIANRLAEAFVGLSSQLEAQLASYRKLVAAAFAQRLHRCWDWKGSAPGRGMFSPFCRRVAGVYEVLRAHQEAPAPHTALSAKFCLWRFRQQMTAALEDLLGDEHGFRSLTRQCKAAARSYSRAVLPIQKRWQYWDWFGISWDFWLDKGSTALKNTLDEARKSREGPLGAEEDELRRRCAEELLRDWKDTKWDRLGQYYLKTPGAKAIPCLVPPLLLFAMLGFLWGSAVISMPVAGLIWVLGTAPYVWYIVRTLRELEVLSSYVHAPAGKG